MAGKWPQSDENAVKNGNVASYIVLFIYQAYLTSIICSYDHLGLILMVSKLNQFNTSLNRVRKQVGKVV